MYSQFEDMKNILKNQYFISTATIVLVALLFYPFSDWIGYHSIALILLLVLSFLGIFLSLRPVLLAAILSTLIWDFFFIPPRFTFTISSQEDVLMMIMYFVVALSNGVFNYKLRQFEFIKHQKEERENAIKLYNTLFDSLSHELRTPIATILGATDALSENDGKLSHQNRQELTTEVSNAALRLHYQVENLLNVSRLDSGFIKPNFEWCDIAELVYTVVQKLQNNLINHKVAVEIAENMPLVKLDFGLTEQILFNLIKNASIHTPNNSEINISAKILTQKEGHFDGDNNRIDTVVYTLILEVADNGKGILNDDDYSVFDKFYRINHSKTGGTGLGLYIVKGFAEAQGGIAKVVNRVGGGANFSVEIPVSILTQNIHYEPI